MSPAPHPRMHGLTHVPGGPDPIPGLLLQPSGGDWEASIRALTGLRGYWRLGEGAEPYADTSGYDPLLQADLVYQAGVPGSTAMTADITPGLLPADQDDGAVGFNHEGNDTSEPQRDYLEPVDVSSNANFDFGTTNPEMSVVARIKPGAATEDFWGGIVSDIRSILPGGGAAWSGGWALQVRFPTLEASFIRGTGDTTETTVTSPPLTAGQEYTLAATYDGADLRLYLDGSQVSIEPDTADLPARHADNNIRVGGYWYQESVSVELWRPFYGVIDEAAVWGRALTAAEIAHLHEQAVAEADGDGDGATARRLLAQLQGPMPASPETSGAYRVPFWGGASIEYTLQRASLHLENVGSTDTSLVIEKSTTADVFTPETVATLTVAASSYLDEETSGLGSLESGNLIRWRWTAVGTDADNFHVTLEGEEA